MRAATLADRGVIEVRDYPEPEPEPGHVLVAMHYASICGSDLHVIFDGFHDETRLGLPGYPGHEGTGTVIDPGGTGLAAGTPVLTVPFGRQGGCFAAVQSVPEAQLVPLPAGGDLRRLLLAQQLGTTVYAMKKFLPADREAPEIAVVVGAGSAGLFFLQQLKARGATVIITDLDAERLATARRFGADVTVHGPEDSVAEATLDHTGGRGAPLVIEAAGGIEARALAVASAAHGATLGAFGYPDRPGAEPFDVDGAFRRALTVAFSNNTQGEPGLASFRTAVELITDGVIEVDHCLQAMYDLEDAAEAVATARDHGRGAAKIGLVLPAAG
ncbi:L-iditol 2-dehydrogenase [Friedmanniella endophytica]|uniref:L-iditol 2-dehydrogenase n=1 Tax=Microlunatus kandeliicorticis TaxID=1759536 RepID=A0A7W3IPT2_9ACTN|nr:zinc-binding dehydrogenase [Microlunatus kandeliicorticis]MBA8792999.1 L-iditol 2-dehydrogenase [Microlunatus kandeliicorticis]